MIHVSFCKRSNESIGIVKAVTIESQRCWQLFPQYKKAGQDGKGGFVRHKGCRHFELERLMKGCKSLIKNLRR